jgi:hypothetical protein
MSHCRWVNDISRRHWVSFDASIISGRFRFKRWFIISFLFDAHELRSHILLWLLRSYADWWIIWFIILLNNDFVFDFIDVIEPAILIISFKFFLWLHTGPACLEMIFSHWQWVFRRILFCLDTSAELPLLYAHATSHKLPASLPYTACRFMPRHSSCRSDFIRWLSPT